MLANLFEATKKSENVLDWRTPEPISALDYLGTQSASPYLMPFSNDRWADKLASTMPRPPHSWVLTVTGGGGCLAPGMLSNVI